MQLFLMRFTLKTIKKIILWCHFHLEITVRLITGCILAAKIISQPYRNNDKIVIHEQYKY